MIRSNINQEAFSFCLLFLLYHASGELATITGVPFEMMGHYSADKFQCLDNSKSLKFSQINDDYCDCLDGSDEPGTSACNNGRFYCQNEHFLGRFIPSIWVNDGYCDCCDGSDEYSTYAAKCNNTCAIIAESHRQKIKKFHEDFHKGHEIYKVYKNTAAEISNKRLVEFKEEREQQIKERTQRSLEEFERKKLEAEQKIAKKQEKIAELEAKKQNNESHDPKEFDPSAEADKIIAEEASIQEKPTEENNTDDNKSTENVTDPSDGQEEEIDINEEITIPTEPDPIVEPPEVKLPDYGPNNVFVHLTEIDCLLLDKNEYTYKLCPFRGAYQMPRGVHNGDTNLGTWGRWLNKESSNPLDEPLEMIYEDGTGCWNGPSRSTRVLINCGESNKLVSVDEPSRCQYKFVILTPAACSITAKEMIELANSNPAFLHEEL